MCKDQRENLQVINKVIYNLVPFLLTVPARINMTGINTKPKILSGTLLTLSCPAVGIPKPNITWYKDGIMLTELTDKLIIDAVDVRDTGKYRCVVRNEAGQSELGFDVKVQGQLYWGGGGVMVFNAKSGIFQLYQEQVNFQ